MPLDLRSGAGAGDGNREYRSSASRLIFVHGFVRRACVIVWLRSRSKLTLAS
jgi:hypothetical protein